MVFILPHQIVGQTTKSTLSGIIYDQNKKLVQGATVRLFYQPTQTQYGCSSNESGRFYLPDLKPGGPYEIEVTSTGYTAFHQKDLYFRFDEPERINITLKNPGIQLPEVVINLFRPGKPQITTQQTGLSTQVDQKLLGSLPAIKRGIQDYVRLNPLSFGPSIAGGNYRQNFITIDGSEFNNNFGVGENLPGNGAQPVSLDAIDQLSVNVAPYNAIWESGFIGSTINIITRSGSNKTQASVYRFFRNQNSYGNQVADQSFDKRKLSYHQDGIRIGGPILRNKLFYFLSLETEREQYNPQPYIAATIATPYGSSTNISRPQATELNEIDQYLRNTYQYDPGTYSNYDFQNKSTKILGRLDWNIAANNTFSIRYNQLRSGRPELVNGSRSPLTAFPVGVGRRNNNALPFSNSNFSTKSNFYSIAAEWNKLLTANSSNTLRASYTKQYEPRKSDSKSFPFVDILKDGVPFTSFGLEPFTYGNSRNVNLLSVMDYVNFSQSRNTWLAGVKIDYSSTTNTYMPFGTGYYTFASWDDFVSGQKPVDYALTYSTNPEIQQPVYSFKYANLAVFAQNSIMLGKHSSLTAGIRVDLPWYPKSLAENTNLAALTFAEGQQVHTSELPQASLLISPRIGVSINLNENGTIRFRGGTGIFTGRIPFVWIISQARYSGLSQITQTWQGKENTPGIFNPDPSAYVPADLTAQSLKLPSITSVLDKDFKMPQTWKSSAGLDLLVSKGLKFKIDVLYNKDIHAITFKDINLEAAQYLNIAGYPDNRLVYPTDIKDRFINNLNSSGLADLNGNSPLNVVKVSNVSKGYYWSMTEQLEKKISNTLVISVAYSRSMAKNLNDGDGDQTLSALNATPSVNGNNQSQLGSAGYVVPHRIVAYLNFHKVYLKKFKVGAALVYQGSYSGRFSYTYSRDFIHDGANKALIYVPKDVSEISFVDLTINRPSLVTYTASQQSEAFFKYIDQDKYLRTRKGKYAERNGALMPWRNQWDIKLTHDFVLGDHKAQQSIQLSWDVLNVGNLLNQNWGIRKIVQASALLVPANLGSVLPNGTVKPTFQLATTSGNLISETFVNDVSSNSTYMMQFGIRYIFN
ncbi:TonB-dependent receptor [Arcticibacter eurypsychrophilus]|uniref:TonB-dependent receptor n=1 Tax=Arcticibacter eurypsychrophilus TaxID=1434752 RepID=UPI000A4A4E3E|nr:carboxypeptidase regulatory-like domain-containing protein [Arcticibacter eurypsychrophilus]